MLSPSTFFSDLQVIGHEGIWTTPSGGGYFEGHFPDFPVMPGVAILDACEWILKKRLLSANGQLVNVAFARFLKPVKPNMSVRIKVRSVSSDEWQFEWSDAGTNDVLAELKVKFS